MIGFAILESHYIGKVMVKILLVIFSPSGRGATFMLCASLYHLKKLESMAYVLVFSRRVQRN